MTFAEVNDRANQLARHLRTLGVSADIAVAVLMERSFDLIIAMMGMQSTIVGCRLLVDRCSYCKMQCMPETFFSSHVMRAAADIQPAPDTFMHGDGY